MASGELARYGGGNGEGDGFGKVSYELVARNLRDFTELSRPLNFVIPADEYVRRTEIVDHTSPVIEPAQTWGMVPFGSVGGAESFLAEIPTDVLGDVGLLGDGNPFFDDSLLRVEIEPGAGSLGGFAHEDLSYRELALLSLENYQIVDVPDSEPFDLYTAGLDFVIPDSVTGMGRQESPARQDLTAITIPGGIDDLAQGTFSHLAEIDPVFLIDEPGDQPWFTTEITGDWRETIVADSPFLASIV